MKIALIQAQPNTTFQESLKNAKTLYEWAKDAEQTEHPAVEESQKRKPGEAWV